MGGRDDDCHHPASPRRRGFHSISGRVGRNRGRANSLKNGSARCLLSSMARCLESSGTRRDLSACQPRIGADGQTGRRRHDCASNSRYRRYAGTFCPLLMTRRRIRHLPVADGLQIVGFVSIGDLVKYPSEEIGPKPRRCAIISRWPDAYCYLVEIVVTTAGAEGLCGCGP